METPDLIPAHILKPEVCYRRAKIFGGLMTRSFGVRLDHQTTQRWVEVVSLFRLIDNYIDGSPAELDDRTAMVLQQIENPVSDYYPSLMPDQLGDERYARVQRFGSQIIRMNHHIKNADSVERYMRLRQYEGRQSARLLVSLSSDEMRAQQHFSRYEIGMDMLGETINLADSFLDIHGDHRRGEVAFTPTPLVYAKLLGRSAARFAYYAPQLTGHR